MNNNNDLQDKDFQSLVNAWNLLSYWQRKRLLWLAWYWITKARAVRFVRSFIGPQEPTAN